MYAIKINNTYLDIDPQSSINVNIINPFFDRDSTERIFSYPFSLQLTPTNLGVFKFANHIDARSRTLKYNAVLEINQTTFETGIVEYQGVSNNRIKIVFRNASRDIFEDLQDIKINEILDTVSSNVSQPNSHWIFDLTVGAPNSFSITIEGNTFTHVAGGGETSEDIVTALSNLIDATYNGMTFNPPGNTQLKLEAAKVNEYQVDLTSLVGLALNSVTTTAEAKQEGFKNYLDDINNTPVDSHCFPVINWFDFYKGSNKKYEFRVNTWFGGTWQENTESENTEWESTYVPMVKIPYLFQKIIDQITELNTLGGTFWNDADIQELILLNNLCIDKLTQDRYSDQVFRFLNHHQETIDLNRHVPEITAKAFLDAFVFLFQLIIDFNHTTLQFIPKINQLQHPPIDWTDKAEPEYDISINTQDGFTLQYVEDVEDNTSIAGQLQPLISGAGEEIIEPLFSTPYMQDTASFSGTYKSPILNQAGSGSEGGLGNNDYSLRLLFFRGLKLSSTSVSYPYATHDDTDYAGGSVGNRTLDWDGPNGLYEKSWKGVAELLTATDTVTKVIRLTIQEVISIRKWQNTRRLIWHPEGQFVGVIKSIQFKVDTSNATTFLAKVELVKQ